MAVSQWFNLRGSRQDGQHTRPTSIKLQISPIKMKDLVPLFCHHFSHFLWWILGVKPPI